MIHVYSVIALVFAVAVFFILGGGSGSNDEGVSASMLNLSVPVAAGPSISSDRFTAQRREEQRMQDNSRVESLQKNSFDLFNIDSSPSNITSSAPAQKSLSSEKKIIQQGKTEAAHKGGVRNNKSSIKDSIMKKKRAQLERELGINLSDYGYERYADAESEPKEAPVNEADDAIPGFYGLESETNVIERDTRAVIHGNHENLTSGAIIKMRLIDDVNIEGVKIPMNTFVFGKLSFKSGRAVIQINSINYNNRILRFNGTVYDADGFEGIYVPDNIVSDTRKKAGSDAISAIDIGVSSKSKIVNSTISAVGNAIKGAVSGSIKEAKISISSNYMITIKKKK